MPVASTQELFLRELVEIHDAEHTFLLGQEAMVQGASDEVLKGAIQNQIQQTGEQARNIERIFEDLGQEPRCEPNGVAKALVKETLERLHETQNSNLRDCAIISAVIKFEHFEMGSYLCLATGARRLGQGVWEHLLRHNMAQAEERAKIAQRSTEELLHSALQAEGEQPGEE
jgi:ferritin-like metal-binding protein YciE